MTTKEQQAQDDQRQRQRQDQALSPEDRLRQQAAEPGSRVPNPAEPYAVTEIPERADASSFLRAAGDRPQPTDYPKVKYHPVHGGVIVKSAEEEGGLVPKTDWFDSPELADAARTWTEAEAARHYNMRRKLDVLEDAGHPVVRNSVQADEALRRGQTEPL